MELGSGEERRGGLLNWSCWVTLIHLPSRNLFSVLAIVSSSCSSQRCEKEGRARQELGACLCPCCLLNQLCVCCTTCSWFLLRGWKNTKKNWINLPNTNVSFLACHESYWVCLGYGKYLFKVKRISTGSSDFEAPWAKSQNTSGWYWHPEVISTAGMGHAHLPAALTFGENAFSQVIHAPAWNFWITDSILD